MAIITIAREIASLGEEVARELSRVTGYRLVDREFLEKRLGEFGVSSDKRQKYDEKKPGFWASLSQERDDYLHYLKTAMFEECVGGTCIIVGRGGVAVFKGVPNTLAVRLVAPLAVRIERVMRFYSCDERHALQILEQSDHDRIGFHKYFFSLDWRDSREYDLVINTARSDVSRIAAAIDSVRSLTVDKEREEAGRLCLSDLLLCQTVVTEIVYLRRVPVHFLEATGEGGRVVLHGVANTQAAIDAALAAARSVKGVVEAESAIQVVQEFTVMP